jgi:hypothetical protein
MFVWGARLCESNKRSKDKDVDTEWTTGKTDNKKGPLGQQATAGAKEIKVPYLFDEPIRHRLASPPLAVTCGHFQTRSTAGCDDSLSNTTQQQQTNIEILLVDRM